MNVVREALLSPAEVETLFVTPGGRGGDVTALADDMSVAVVPVAEHVMEALSETATPQGAVAVVVQPESSLDALAEDADLVVVLAEVRDPGNAGTIVRSAVGAAADAVIFSSSSVDPWGPKTVRASAGAVFRTAVLQAPLGDVADALRARGFTLAGADAGAATPCDAFDWTRRCALVVGNEAWGLPEAAAELLDERVSIPMPGPLESLNAATAASVLLYEVVRQRRAAGRG